MRKSFGKRDKTKREKNLEIKLIKINSTAKKGKKSTSSIERRIFSASTNQKGHTMESAEFLKKKIFFLRLRKKCDKNVDNSKYSKLLKNETIFTRERERDREREEKQCKNLKDALVVIC